MFKTQRVLRNLTAMHLFVQDTLPKEIVKKKGPFLIPIADPLADEKMTKKVLKLAKKASKRKQTKRGTKEVVKSIRKGLKGCVIPHALPTSQHGRMTVGPEGLQVGADNSAASGEAKLGLDLAFVHACIPYSSRRLTNKSCSEWT